MAAAGHGPGRNPTWVNVLLVVLVLVAVSAWRIRTVRSRRLSGKNSERNQGPGA